MSLMSLNSSRSSFRRRKIVLNVLEEFEYLLEEIQNVLNVLEEFEDIQNLLEDLEEICYKSVVYSNVRR